ncbi:hypothetical protein OOK36_34760 [Streptomyces sp. NBC_00365]|uniref:hypothetical protein n=1 Tax=Streptomyces sp. NBC_00365 TaxID=2975726 RepID=UPI002257A42E|nr:hypothetical protein [Streptomyces sp. NBC_00365]MCX5093947.1 hypothetical protein [Streptomyces sp. NBC_00365]
MHLGIAIALVNWGVSFFSPASGPVSGSGAEFPLMVIAACWWSCSAVRGRSRSTVPSAWNAATTRPAPDRHVSARPHGPPPAQPAAVRGGTVGGLIGGVVGAAMSAVVNYSAIGMPSGVGANTANHAVS